jgi:hypothetical protein
MKESRIQASSITAIGNVEWSVSSDSLIFDGGHSLTLRSLLSQEFY